MCVGGLDDYARDDYASQQEWYQPGAGCVSLEKGQLRVNH